MITYTKGKHMTLVILAAGLGSRYGGLKQIDPITEHGEFIIDFSCFDAIRAGFDKIIFIIKEENYEVFRSTIGNRIEKHVKVEYCFQKLDDLPEGYSIPEGRTKPWGTAHALLAARASINDTFAVINADDFYGREAYEKLASHLRSVSESGADACCMVGYRLENTLTENGSVSRGICQVNENGELDTIVERVGIVRQGSDAAYYGDDGELYPLFADSVASMNCWGLTPAMLTHMWYGFENFLAALDYSDPTTLKKEYYLPYSIADAKDDGKCTVKVYSTAAVWHGVTYHEDKESVKRSISELVASGEYPDGLWK